ncbi:MAG: DivIVA domain-containing protein [Acidimicrobiales bacterium]|jgi:DivIVA domain-containing protein
MEISGRILREVEFRDRLRGYDTDEVDEFLEKVAVAVDELIAQLAAGREKTTQESPALDDESLRRTLVLAQRTADLAVREAREEAAALLEDARREAATLTTEARGAAGRLRSEAELDAHKRITDLEARRAQLEGEIEELGRYALAERGRISAALSAALESLGGMMSVDREPLVRQASPAEGPFDESVAMPATGVLEEPDDVAEDAEDGPTDDGPDTTDTAPVLRSGTNGHPHRESLASQLGLTDDDVDDGEPPPPPAGRNLRAVDSADGVDPDEALWQRWARGADLDAGPKARSSSARPAPSHRSSRGDGGWTA